ncbi:MULTISPECIES: hypothetical protein [unclassified Holdemanella]|uniref:hypothetical protein n=1 Tax=unclassified Holdemanella TaxID=2633909 RepID=UPI001D09D5BD|nr:MULTISPECIES: hypothetical protein [unclassified Holdemanella]MCB8642134.1 hypothetical protein [Holdemanella sp. DFI.5.55]MCG5650482.1 hypothetical protein [Holdemanella sp. DFI.5.21]
MLNKKLFSTSLVLSILLVGCSSVKENEVKENKEKVEEVEVQVQEEKNVESNESVPVVQEYSNSNNQVQEYSAPIEENSNDTYVPEVKETPQPEDNGEREIVLVREEIPACDDTIPYGAYTSYDEANSAAKAALNETFFAEGWMNGHYGVDTHQTECGTIYYTYWYEEFIGD